MTKRNYIYFLILTFILSCNNNDIIVKPGSGVDDISIGNSDSIDVLNYRNLEFIRTSGTAHVDGFDWYCEENWIRYHSPLHGLTFTFSTPCVTNPDDYELSLVKITLEDSPHAVLENGIRIGETTYNDVISIYGKPFENWQNETYLEYEDLSLGLRFDEEEVLYEITLF